MSKFLARQKRSLKHTSPYPEVSRALLHVGLFARVAKRETLSIGHVIQVAKGRRTSRRVIDAIVREVRRIEESVERAA